MIHKVGCAHKWPALLIHTQSRIEFTKVKDRTQYVSAELPSLALGFGASFERRGRW